jgi:ribosomal protein L30/L7E
MIELVHGLTNSLPTSVETMRLAVLRRLVMSSALKKDRPFIRAMVQAMQNETTADELNAVLGSDHDSE